jgi:hypothetical protein
MGVLACLLVVLAAGCSRRLLGPEQRTSTLTIYGYTFILEHPEGTDMRQEGKRTDDGQGHIDEDIKITCGQQVLRIVNGKVTLNGEERGPVKQGDNIKLTAAGKVWVNQQPRDE